MAELAALAESSGQDDRPQDDQGSQGARGLVASAFGGHHRLAVRPARDGDEGTFRIRRYGEHGIELTRFLPVLESFGLVVVESVPLPGRSGP